MALPSAALVEELLQALTEWEAMLQRQYNTQELRQVYEDPEATVGQLDEIVPPRQSAEDALAAAQRRRSSFLHSEAAKYVVPTPWSITYWYDEPTRIKKKYRNKKQPGGGHRRKLQPTIKQKTLQKHK